MINKINCDCIDKMNKELIKYCKDENAHISITQLFNVDCIEKYPYIKYFWKKKKNDGTYCNKLMESPIIPTYCPFCGQRYKDENNDK